MGWGVASSSMGAPDLPPDFVVENRTPQQEKSYKERLYDLQRKVMNNKIYEYPKFEDNEDNGRQEENDNKIEEIVQLPNVDQTLYTVVSGKNKKKKIALQTKTKESMQ